MKKALSQISKSPFTQGIEKAKLPRKFHQPMFAKYNGRTDPVEHVSQFKQKMAVHSQDEDVQGISIKLKIDADEMVRWTKD